MAATAIPKKIEKTTSCRISPSAIALNTDVGKSMTSMSQPVCALVSWSVLSAAVPSVAIVSPAPGWKKFTSPSPRNSAIVVATSK